MFDRFGEFNSVEELNMAAEGFLKEGDLESLRALAVENGIDVEDAEDYIARDTEKLATLAMAAFGRIVVLKREETENKGQAERMVIAVIAKMLEGMMVDVEIQSAIMHSGKRLEKIYNALRNAADKHRAGSVGVSCGTDRELCSIIKAYYKVGEEEMKRQIEKLYKRGVYYEKERIAGDETAKSNQ